MRKPERRRPLGTSVHGRGNIKTDLREIGWDDMDWIHLAQGSVARSSGHGNEPSGIVN
jgi:hypothetical protein